MSAIFAKEFKSTMRSMTGPIFIAFMLFWFGFFTIRVNFGDGVSGFEYTISSAAFLSLLALPLITMRQFAEERHTGCDKLLLSLPVKTGALVMAKYLSALAVFAIPTAVLALFPLILSKYGVVYLNTAYSSLFAYFLLGATLIAIGVFISSLTESQVIAAIFSLASIILLFFIPDLAYDLPQTAGASLIFLFILAAALAAVTWVLTKSPVASAIVFLAGVCAAITAFLIDKSMFEGLATKWINSLNIFSRTYPFFSGKLDITSIVYFVSISGFFLFLTWQSVEKRRWN